MDVDSTLNTLKKMIREAELKQYNYILTIGRNEVAARSVNVRARSGAQLGEQKVDEFLSYIQAEKKAYGVGYSHTAAPATAPPKE